MSCLRWATSKRIGFGIVPKALMGAALREERALDRYFLEAAIGEKCSERQLSAHDASQHRRLTPLKQARLQVDRCFLHFEWHAFFVTIDLFIKVFASVSENIKTHLFFYVFLVLEKLIE